MAQQARTVVARHATAERELDDTTGLSWALVEEGGLSEARPAAASASTAASSATPSQPRPVRTAGWIQAVVTGHLLSLDDPTRDLTQAGPQLHDLIDRLLAAH